MITWTPVALQEISSDKSDSSIVLSLLWAPLLLFIHLFLDGVGVGRFVVGWSWGGAWTHLPATLSNGKTPHPLFFFTGSLIPFTFQEQDVIFPPAPLRPPASLPAAATRRSPAKDVFRGHLCKTR